MRNIGRLASRYFSNQGFNSRGGVFGERWEPLNRAYAIAKARRFPGKPPLVATGAMRDGFFAKPRQSSVVIDNRAPQYKYHQSTAPRSKLPRRPMAAINDPIREIVRQELQKSIEKKIRMAG